ncbi:GlxA family transcriptional regulator [Sphingobium chlorophenolicum]|uniref:Transcriptional regulator, AraC family n=1 Tax=Sphingobium chlorophenolicum TaxID=46429 RepID=A0A081RGR9_SPHCR|nr:helix-turn-helix domain-containing protein [Sphingobium chlorophenolicum]KEQ54392.1 Transcriptional regulator, AraC family [Sphingobium chlorophenolicum]
MARDVAVIGFDGACLASIGLFLDLFGQMRLRVASQFRSRDDIGMHTRAKLLGPTPRPIQVLGGWKLQVEDGLDATPHLYIHVPDFYCAEEATPEYLARLQPVIDWLRAQHAGGAQLSATGRGMELLAEAGLIGNGPVPVARGAAADFRGRYPHIRVNTTEPITEVGRIMMARGMTQEMSLLTRLIGRMLSPTMAGTLADAMGMETDRPGLSDDPLVAAAQMWLSERASRGLHIGALAAHLAVSPQTLIRRFRAKLDMTPRDYLRLVRMRSAQSQLRDTSRPISQIATLIGYNDLKSFQQAFRQHAGMSASRYRAFIQQEGGDASSPTSGPAGSDFGMPLILC